MEGKDPNLYGYVLGNPINRKDPFGLFALIECKRCGVNGSLLCDIWEADYHLGELKWSGWFKSNYGKNYKSRTKGDPYGKDGPLPPDEYFEVTNAWSDKFGPDTPSPSNSGEPGVILRPTVKREGVRFHIGTESKGCITYGKQSEEACYMESKIKDLVDEHEYAGGTFLIIHETDCCEWEEW